MLISREEFVTKFSDRIKATKKISKVDGVEDVLTRIYYTIEYFNTLPEFTVSIGGRQLCDIIVADEWKDFIRPESVRLDPTDLKTSNLLKKIDKTNVDPKDTDADYINDIRNFDAAKYLTFINDQATIRSYFKSDLNNNTTNLAVLRANKSLMDVIPVVAVENGKGLMMCRSLDEPYIPVQLVKGVDCLFRTDYFNTTIDTIFADYLSKKVIA